MIFEETKLKGVYFIKPEKHQDERGFFARVWCQKEFAANGLVSTIVQANTSYSRKRGTLRGIHYQIAPFQEAKVVRCVRGAIYDVVIDLRPSSSTYLQWIGLELTDENQHILYVPKGFAKGFVTLCDDTEVSYQVSEFYTPSHERGIRWNDPALGICWPEVGSLTISEKDRNWPDFRPA